MFHPHLSLPYEQITKFVQHLLQKEVISPKTLRFAILMTCRSDETFGAT